MPEIKTDGIALNALITPDFIGVRANFFYSGAEPSLPERFFDSARKTAMLTCRITLPDSPQPMIISKKSRISGTNLSR